MHCKSCEIVIKKWLNELDGCKVLSLSHKTWKLEIQVDDIIDEQDIEWVLQEHWYSLKTIAWWLSSQDFSIKLLWLVVAIILWVMVMNIDVTQFMPQYSSLTVGVAILVWWVASISTCLAVTWGLLIWYNAHVESENIMTTQVLFHLWRLGGFALGGLLLGAVWTQISWTPLVNAILAILVGVLLVYLWGQMLWLVPNMSKRWFHLPEFLSKPIHHLKNPVYAPLVWALTFLLPCGFTQSMQLFALQSWDPFTGFMIMTWFALGTLPVLFAVGAGTHYIKKKLKLIQPLIATLLLVFGVFTITNAYQLINALQTVWPQTSSWISNNLPIETREIWHDGSQFVPETIKLQQGKNYILRVTPTQDGIGCMYQVVVPGKWPQDIKQGQVFEIFVDGASTKTIPLVCSSMGMRQWEIVVE